MQTWKLCHKRLPLVWWGKILAKGGISISIVFKARSSFISAVISVITVILSHWQLIRHLIAVVIQIKYQTRILISLNFSNLLRWPCMCKSVSSEKAVFYRDRSFCRRRPWPSSFLPSFFQLHPWPVKRVNRKDEKQLAGNIGIGSVQQQGWLTLSHSQFSART